MYAKRRSMHARPDKFLDRLMAFAIIVLMIGLAFGESGTIIRKAEMTNAFSVFAGARIDLSEYFAMYGTWPDHMDAKDYRSDKRPDLDVQDGAITIDVRSRQLHDTAPKTLSLRPAALPGNDAAVVIWLCGNHPVPSGMRPAGKNSTSLQTKELYAMCR